MLYQLCIKILRVLLKFCMRYNYVGYYSSRCICCCILHKFGRYQYIHSRLDSRQHMFFHLDSEVHHISRSRIRPDLDHHMLSTQKHKVNK